MCWFTATFYCHVLLLRWRRAAAIKASGINILVGLASEDAIIPVLQQRQLAAALGARAEVLCGGHMDGFVLDGVGCMARLREQGLLPGLEA